MEPTAAQSERVKTLRKAFGKDVIHPHAPDPRTGVMRVDLDSLAGLHEWYYGTDGNLIDRHITARLFDMPQAAAKPRNAIDN